METPEGNPRGSGHILRHRPGPGVAGGSSRATVLGSLTIPGRPEQVCVARAFIAQTLGTQDFARLRIGIGKPPSKEQGADYVLRRATGKQREALAADVALAADALETLLDTDFDEAQRRVNGS